ncbi:MAG: hypothetical protein IJW55_05840 [Clostridia bacterium]|nr:hypothetical protein [Clostridia bacterium]
MNQHKQHSQRPQPAPKCIRFLSFLLAMILLLTCLSACKKEKQPTNEELIENRITTFVTAYNDGDMDTVMSCLDAKTRNAFQAMLNLLGGLAGSAAGFNIDLSDLFSLGVSTTTGDFMELEITNITVIDNENATATTTMDLTGAGTQTIYFVMVYENNGWYIHDMTDEQIGDSINNSNQTGTNINVLEMNSIYNENAQIKFEMNDKTYSGIINSKGEIIYYSEEKYINWTSIGNSAGFVTTYTDDDKKIYTLFNENGYKTITVNEDVFDTIIGYGDGLILVYKNTSTITTEEHSYGVLDCNGTWIKQLTAGTKLPNSDDSSGYPFEYIGDGVFMYFNDYGFDYRYILFNSITNESYYIQTCRIYSDCFSNGVIYGKNVYHGTISDYSNQTERIDMPSYFALRADGTFEEVSEFTDAYNDFLINKNGEYMCVVDKTNNTEKEYTAFPSETISSIQFDGNFGLVILNGADGKTYFTVIDKECNQKVAPTVCLSAAISDGRIVYKNSDNIYEVIDVNGSAIVSKNQSFTYISNYSGGIAKAEDSDGECYIGLDGKPLTIKLK